MTAVVEPAVIRVANIARLAAAADHQSPQEVSVARVALGETAVAGQLRLHTLPLFTLNDAQGFGKFDSDPLFTRALA